MSTEEDQRGAERVLAWMREEAAKPLEPELYLERTRTFSSPGFSRMKTRWNPAEQSVISAAKAQANDELMVAFADVYQILHAFYAIVRTPRVDGNGEEILDQYGFPLWQLDDVGRPIENWTLLTEGNKDHFIHSISTRLVLWEEAAADFWGDAMFSKGLWEERFAEAFVTTPKVDDKRPTEADKTQHAQGESREDRYFAIYKSVISKKADALVRSMERLCMRLNNTKL